MSNGFNNGFHQMHYNFPTKAELLANPDKVREMKRIELQSWGTWFRNNGYEMCKLNAPTVVIQEAVYDALVLMAQLIADTAKLKTARETSDVVETVKIDCYANLFENMVAEFEETILYDTYSIEYRPNFLAWMIHRRDSGVRVLVTGDMDELTAWMGGRIKRLGDLARLKQVTVANCLEVLHSKDYPITASRLSSLPITLPASQSFGSVLTAINRYFDVTWHPGSTVTLHWSQAA